VAEQPLGTIVDCDAPGDAPQPLTLNHPASNPGCSSGWGSSFSGHQEFATGPLPAAVFDFRQAKNEFNRPPSSGLRTCTIRDEDWFRWLGMRGRDVLLDRQCALRGRQLAASFLARERQEARRQRKRRPTSLTVGNQRDQLASRQAVAGIRPSSASSCSRTGSRSPSIASRKTERANSSGFTVVLPIDLSVSHASSNAASNTTSVGGSKELLWKPR
jgi:hypothetical protein